jgi:methylglutaconyl-CoA hydratase
MTEASLDYTTIVVEENGPIRTIVLNRPERRNALSPQMQLELIEAFEEAAASSCRVIVLTGAGKAFCAGLDLAALESMKDATPLDHRAEAERVVRLFLTLHELPVPTIAAVHGAAIAGGCGLATICDFTLATPSAKFGFTEVRIGFIPALVSAFVTLQVGDKQSRDLLLTGRIFGAEEALQLGLVNEIVPQEKLAGHVQALAETLIANSPQALAATKQLMAAQHKQWLDAAIVAGIEASIEARETPDFREGIAAFLGKRKPAWTK